jgi:hypothetical protein
MTFQSQMGENGKKLENSHKYNGEEIANVMIYRLLITVKVSLKVKFEI